MSWSSQASTSPPERTIRSAPASASASLGRGSYSWGSALAARICVTSPRSPATLRVRSATWAVVATTVGPLPESAPESLQPDSAAASSA